MPSTKGFLGSQDFPASERASRPEKDIGVSSAQEAEQSCRTLLDEKDEFAALQVVLEQERKLRMAAEEEAAHLRTALAEQQAATAAESQRLVATTSELQDLRMMFRERQRRLSEAEANARDAATEVLRLREELQDMSSSSVGPDAAARGAEYSIEPGVRNTPSDSKSCEADDQARQLEEEQRLEEEQKKMEEESRRLEDQQRLEEQQTKMEEESRQLEEQQRQEEQKRLVRQRLEEGQEAARATADPLQHPLHVPTPLQRQAKPAPKSSHPLQAWQPKQLPVKAASHVTGGQAEETASMRIRTHSAANHIAPSDADPSESWNVSSESRHAAQEGRSEQAHEMDDFTWRRHPAMSENRANAADSEDTDWSDHYQVLCVGRTASADDIRHGYRRQALRWHPDKNPTDRQRAEQRFKRVAEAYAVLSDTQRRIGYDRAFEAKESAVEKTFEFQENDLWGAGSAYKVFERFFGTSDPFQNIWFPGDP